MDTTSKVADALVQVAARVTAAQSAGSDDLVGLSNGLVHVRADGAIEVILHTQEPATPANLQELAGLGGEVVESSVVPPMGGVASSGVVQAWVPAGALSAVASRPWVAAVTPPAYPPTGG